MSESRSRPLTKGGPAENIPDSQRSGDGAPASAVRDGGHDRVIPRQRVTVPGADVERSRRLYRLDRERGRRKVIRALDRLLMGADEPNEPIDYHECGLDLGWVERAAAAPRPVAGWWWE